MNAFPFSQKIIASFGNFSLQAPHVGLLDANLRNDFDVSIRADKIDLGLPWPGYMNMGWFMIEGVNHNPEPMSTVNNYQFSITYLLGFFNEIEWAIVLVTFSRIPSGVCPLAERLLAGAIGRDPRADQQWFLA